MCFVRLRQYLAYLALRALIALVQMLPLPACAALARGLALVFDMTRVRGGTIAENLRHAFPDWPQAERRRLARQMWEHLFLFVAEVAHTPRKVHETNWKDHVAVREGQTLVRLLLDERPVVLVSGHFGNFELCGYVLALFGYPTHSVARTLDNPYLDEFVNRFRASTGQRMLSKRGDLERIVDILAAGGTLGFLADQYAGSKGCWVEFFGRPASAHKAIALFALQHDAPVVVGYCRRIGGPLEYEMGVEAVADPRDVAPHVSSLRELTQWYTSQLESMIRQSPEQYWWLHRRWKDHRPQRKKRQAA